MSLRPPPVLTPFDDGTGTPPRPWILWIQEAASYIGKHQGYGTTAERPTNNVMTGDVYFDTTLGFPVWWGGASWSLSVFASASDDSTVSVTSPDASTVSGTSTTGGEGFTNVTEFNNAITAINTIKTLANECKGDINTLVTDLNHLKGVLRTAGIIAT